MKMSEWRACCTAVTSRTIVSPPELLLGRPVLRLAPQRESSVSLTSCALMLAVVPHCVPLNTACSLAVGEIRDPAQDAGLSSGLRYVHFIAV